MTARASAAALLALLAHLPMARAADLPNPRTAAASEYRVGPGDILEVRLPGARDDSRQATVQMTGAIYLACVGDVKVAGMSVREIESVLEQRAAFEEPRGSGVRVLVKEYQSQFVWVEGQVNRPGRKALRGGTRLVDALLEAGGFTTRASGEVVVERKEGSFADGTAARRFWFTGGSPTPEQLQELETVLAAGDTVSAAAIRLVSVQGAVLRPGRYALKQGTLTEALSAAGGPSKFAAGRVMVKGLDPDTRATRVFEVDLDEVRDGRHAEPVLVSGDEVVVKARVL